MKPKDLAQRLTLSTLLFLLTLAFAYAQAPQGFSYQAVVRNGSGLPVANKTVNIRITLEDAAHLAYYTETQSALTNQQGVFSITIGNGTVEGNNLFENIPWANGDIFLKVEVDPEGGTAYTTLGTPSKLQAVPYALYAENTKEVVSQPTALDDDPIFVVKNKVGQTVFAVYQTGVRVYVEDTPVVKGARGGFAVGGLSQSKASTVNEYFRITSDSARIYVKNPVGKGARGGFAVGGLSQSKSTANNFMVLNPDNYSIGQDAGKSITGGLYNSFIGYQAGMKTTLGNKNVFIGYRSGITNTSGSSNVFIGDSVGVFNTSGEKNVFIGNYAGKNNIFGGNNVYIGYQAGYLGNYGGQNICIGNYAGYSNTSSQNLFIGEYSGEKNTSGYRNTFVGFFAGQENLTGGQNSYFGQFAGVNNTASYNTFIGYWSGGLNVSGANNSFLGYRSGQGSSGSNNVFLGYQAGEGNTGSGNILIGYQAGFNSGNKSNVLYVSNSNTPNPLIYGDFANGKVAINTNNPSTYTFYVNGSAAGTSAWANLSDERLKKNISTIPDALNKVMKLRGVNYEWKDPNNPEKGIRMGFIAQEAEKIIPEVVNKDGELYSMQYAPVNALLVEAIKEQQNEIEALKAELEALKALLKK